MIYLVHNNLTKTKKNTFFLLFVFSFSIFIVFFVFLAKIENTQCILDNFLLCHFHNPNFNMSTIDNMLLMANSHSNQVIYDEYLSIQRLFRSCLPDEHVSCVRQLLNEGIH